MKRLNLTRFSLDTLRAVLLAVTALCAGCGDEPVPSSPSSPMPLDPPDVSLFDRPLCTPDGRISTHQLNPSKPLDYYELQSAGYIPPRMTPTHEVLEGTGIKCRTASDVNKCNDAFSLLNGPDSGGFHLETYAGIKWYYFATTAGDAVAVNGKLQDFLGEIDTPQEALLFLWANWKHISCDDPNRGGVRKVAEGYEVITWYADYYPRAQHRVLYLVPPDGNFRELWSEVAPE